MNPGAPQSASARRASATALKPLLTHVELTWHEKKIEHWIRFGHPAHEQILDRRRRIVSFAPDAIFAFVRSASNASSTIISRLDIVRALRTGEPHQPLPFVHPGGAILPRADAWRRGPGVLHAIDPSGGGE